MICKNCDRPLIQDYSHWVHTNGKQRCTMLQREIDIVPPIATPKETL